MAKITNLLLCIVFLYCSCHPRVALDRRNNSGNTSDSVTIQIPISVSQKDTVIKVPVEQVQGHAVNQMPITVFKDSSVTITTVKTIEKKYPSIQSVYKSFVGIREATGHNDGKEVKLFLSHVGLPEGYAWCAAAVRTGYDSAGIKTTINGAAASVDNPKNRGFYKGVFIHSLKPGDAFTLYYPSLGRIGHTGFYDAQINSTSIITYEGNTNVAGSREGDGFYKKLRPLNGIHTINMWR